MTEIELLASFRRGETEAFHALRERHAGALWRLARMRGASDAEAEDLVQETFLAAYSGRERFHGRSSLGTYLTAILLRRQRDGLRRRKTEPLPDERPSTNDLESTALTRLRVRDALAALAPADRDVLLLVSVAGLTSREAGDALRISDAAVRQRLVVATRRLRALLPDFLEEEDHALASA